MDRLATEVFNWAPRDALRAALFDALAVRGVEDVTPVDSVSPDPGETGRPRLRTLFEVDVQEVVLRECERRWTFCGEMKVRGQLRDLDTGRILYDGILVSSNLTRRFSFAKRWHTRPYEWLVNADAACRPIGRYCDPEGPRLIVEDLDAAARVGAQRLVAESGVSPGPGE